MVCRWVVAGQETEDVAGGFSRVTGTGECSPAAGWWWKEAASAGGVCRVQEECSRHGLMGRVPRIQGGGAGCGGEHARGV